MQFFGKEIGESRKGRFDVGGIMELAVGVAILGAVGAVVISGFNSTVLGVTGAAATLCNTVVPLAFVGVAIFVIVRGGTSLYKGK